MFIIQQKLFGKVLFHHNNLCISYFEINKTLMSLILFQTGQEEINLNMIRDLYFKNQEIFDKEPTKIIMNHKFQVKLSELIQNYNDDDRNLYIW